MPQQQFVVLNPANGLYFIGYNGMGQGEEPMFGSLVNAITYGSQEAADAAAASIGGGTVGTTKPR